VKLHLPHTLNLIADAAGIDAAIELALRHGGSRLRIPQRAEGSQLEKIVGLDAARAIVAEMADDRIEIPAARRALAVWLRENRGWSQERIAKELHASRRSVQNWLSEKEPDRQFDMFDKAI
jgi:hypothetical protein